MVSVFSGRAAPVPRSVQPYRPGRLFPAQPIGLPGVGVSMRTRYGRGLRKVIFGVDSIDGFFDLTIWIAAIAGSLILLVLCRAATGN
ncbi:hypothetical protein ACIP23_34285, partial [Streptomyces sp. NPDC089733]|uniref:hypothetical protein n=1 Tax=Streptomyces sp. NPDC089733 TaxID=3365918 RepID=UPI0038145B5D